MEFSETHIPVFNASPWAAPARRFQHRAGKAQRALWGIRPEWKARPSRLLINSRTETASQRLTFRESFRQRRCLVCGWVLRMEGDQGGQAALPNRPQDRGAIRFRWDLAGSNWRAYLRDPHDGRQQGDRTYPRPNAVILERDEKEPWLDQELPAEDVLKLLILLSR